MIAGAALLGLLAGGAAFAAPKTLWPTTMGRRRRHNPGNSFHPEAIDAAAAVGGTITMKAGTYLTGSLFLKSGVTLDVPEGVTLIGSEKVEDYPMLPTRIAGIEMTWPAL